MKSLFQRGVAMIVLVAMLLAPVSLCHAQSGAAKHACCAQAAHQSVSVQPDCCAVRAPSPAAVIVRAVPVPDAGVPARIEHVELLPVDTRAEIAPAPAVHSSPPPGASVLRI